MTSVDSDLLALTEVASGLMGVEKATHSQDPILSKYICNCRERITNAIHSLTEKLDVKTLKEREEYAQSVKTSRIAYTEAQIKAQSDEALNGRR